MTDTAGVHTYTYDATNRLTSADGVTYTWDARGNLTHDGIFTYTYNSAGRLARAQSLTSTLVYTYSAQGLRVAQSVDGDVTEFAWDWASGLPEMLSEGQAMGSSIALYLVGHETLGQWDGVAWAYYLPDALGSVRQEVDGAGAVVGAREWSPFGVEVSTVQAGLGYTGEWSDPNVGMTYLRARWLASSWGRFTQRDSWEGNYEQPLTLNPYLYVLANPVNILDPSGQQPLHPLEDTDILDVPWVDEMAEGTWKRYPNSCGLIALYMLLRAEGVPFKSDLLASQLKRERPGGYDSYCCSQGWGEFPTPTPDPLGWCNKACVSAEALADVARKYYGLAIESGDHWTREKVHRKLLAGHPVLALVRVNLRTLPPDPSDRDNPERRFGHFVVIRGLINRGTRVVFNDSYPRDDRQTWNMSSEERRAIGEGRQEDWSDFDDSWASAVDQNKDCLAPQGHVRWAMAVKSWWHNIR